MLTNKESNQVDKAAGHTTFDASIIIRPKGSADHKPDAKIINRILQMDDEAVARELSAEHRLIIDGWGGHYCGPSLVYMPEKDRLLLRYFLVENHQQHACEAVSHLLIFSDDRGQTWSDPILRDNFVDYHVPGMSMTYLGEGKLIDAKEETGENTKLFSGDYGETWSTFPSSHTLSGFPFCVWDPCLVDRDPNTGVIERIITSGCSLGAEKIFEHAKRIIRLPNEWHWKHDPQDLGLTEAWYQDEAYFDWPQKMKIDQHWTVQGEPAGIGWYATEFEMPKSQDKPLVVLFGAVDGYCDVFIDGQKVGEQKEPPEIMWSRPFHVSLPQGLSQGQHVMVIRVQKDPAPESNAGIYLPICIAEDIEHQPGEPDYSWPRQNALLRISYDGGRTWPKEIHPPNWNGDSGVGANEIALCRAANGDIVAALRIVHPDYYGGKADPDRHTTIDHYCGLGASVSKDNGLTWSKINILYEYGHMHPCMVVLPGGEMVMTYAVRMGALKTQHRVTDDDGYSQWSVEAIISRDHGQSWDLTHRYILGRWSGSSQSQSTSTVLMPDGSLLTAFGSGYLSSPDKADISITHEICLARWRLGLS